MTYEPSREHALFMALLSTLILTKQANFSTPGTLIKGIERTGSIDILNDVLRGIMEMTGSVRESWLRWEIEEIMARIDELVKKEEVDNAVAML